MKERPLAGVRLTPRNGLVDLMLAGTDFDEATVAESTRWGNAVMAVATLHLIGKPNRLARQRLTKADANRALRLHLKKIGGGA